MKKISYFLSSAVLFCASFPQVATSATSNGTLGVNAIVGAGCQINSGTVSSGNINFGNLDFGSLNTVGGQNVDAQTTGSGNGSIVMECSSGASFSITLDNGQHFAGGTRAMVNTSNSSILLNYTLYQNAARTLPWTTSSPLTRTGTGAPVTLDVYGRIPGGQTGITAGTYNDTVQVVISW